MYGFCCLLGNVSHTFVIQILTSRTYMLNNYALFLWVTIRTSLWTDHTWFPRNSWTMPEAFLLISVTWWVKGFATVYLGWVVLIVLCALEAKSPICLLTELFGIRCFACPHCNVFSACSLRYCNWCKSKNVILKDPYQCRFMSGVLCLKYT